MRSAITLVSALSAISLSGVLAQTTVPILQPDILLSDDQLQGEIVGVGADGTTYVFSNIVTDTASDDVAFTETVVQDATHLSVMVGASLDDGDVAYLQAECTFTGIDPTATALPAGCVLVEQEVFDSISTTATMSATGTLIPVSVAVSTASGIKVTPSATSGASAGSGSGSGAGASATGTSSGASSVKLGAAFVLAMPILSMLASFM